VLFSALNVRYRDFRYIVGFVLQFGLFASPVAYSISIVPEPWQLVYAFNPMVGVIEGFRWCLAGTTAPLNVNAVALGVAMSIALLVLAIAYFRATERTFADVI
jgi:lipopolysaccharide transport system permease protein